MRFKAHAAVVIAALIAGLLQVSSARGEVNPPAATVQAEQMTLPAGASIVNDAAANGGKAVKMTQRSTSLNGQVGLLTSVSSVSLIAKGTKYKGGWPSMSMKIDGSTVIPLTAVSFSAWHA